MAKQQTPVVEQEVIKCDECGASLIQISSPVHQNVMASHNSLEYCGACEQQRLQELEKDLLAKQDELVRGVHLMKTNLDKTLQTLLDSRNADLNAGNSARAEITAGKINLVRSLIAEYVEYVSV